MCTHGTGGKKVGGGLARDRKAEHIRFGYNINIHRRCIYIPASKYAYLYTGRYWY